jgi:hypothetical protein
MTYMEKLVMLPNLIPYQPFFLSPTEAFSFDVFMIHPGIRTVSPSEDPEATIKKRPFTLPKNPLLIRRNGA